MLISDEGGQGCSRRPPDGVKGENPLEKASAGCGEEPSRYESFHTTLIMSVFGEDGGKRLGNCALFSRFD